MLFNFTNDEYDPSQAKEKLQSISKVVPYPLVKEIPSRPKVTDLFSECTWTFQPESNNLATFRIIEHAKAEDGQSLPEEEVVFALRGILADKQLPPIVKTSSAVDKVAHLSQSATITGLDSPAFSNVVDSFYCLQEQFQNLVGDEKCEGWTPKTFDSEEFLAITASNKYFRKGRLPPHCKPIKFSTFVDPHNVLQGFNGGKLKHTDDNVVQYWETKEVVADTDKLKVGTINPLKFAPGQIVEVQVSVIFVKGQKRGKYMLLPILRGINILDDTVLKLAREKKSNRRLNNTVNNSSFAYKAGVKRKVGYQTEDVEMTANKLQKNT